MYVCMYVCMFYCIIIMCRIAGYAPLSVRLVQALGGPVSNWNSIADAMRLLPGPMVEFTQSESLSEELPEAIARFFLESIYNVCVIF